MSPPLVLQSNGCARAFTIMEMETLCPLAQTLQRYDENLKLFASTSSDLMRQNIGFGGHVLLVRQLTDI